VISVPLILQTIITAQMMSIGEEGATQEEHPIMHYEERHYAV